MKSDLKTRHGGRILADALVAQGAKLAFGVPGESYLPVLDGLHDVREQLAFIVCRQEGGASYMAEAYGKLTGEPGVLFVTRGPGATNGAIGVHTGFQDSTPMVVFIGQVPNEFAEREAFQEIDYRRMYGQMAKWVAQIDRVERIPEYVSHAFHTAVAGRPGPVVLALPEDALFAEAAVADVPKHHTVRPSPSAAELEDVRAPRRDDDQRLYAARSARAQANADSRARGRRRARPRLSSRARDQLRLSAVHAGARAPVIRQARVARRYARAARRLSRMDHAAP